MLHRTRDAHVAETALLLQLRRIIPGDRHVAWENAILHAGKEYVRELQSFCGMQCHQQHVIALLIHRVDIRHQRNLLQKTTERWLFGALLIIRNL